MNNNNNKLSIMSNVAIITVVPSLTEQFKDVENIEFCSRDNRLFSGILY